MHTHSISHTLTLFPHSLSHTNTHCLTHTLTQVTLVDQSERFVFKPLLYELLNGAATEAEVSPSYGTLLSSLPVHFIQVWGWGWGCWRVFQ